MMSSSTSTQNTNVMASQGSSNNTNIVSGEQILKNAMEDNNKVSMALQNLPFDNRLLKKLPVDLKQHPGAVPRCPGVCFSKVSPTPVIHPVLVAYSKPVLEDLLGVIGVLADVKVVEQAGKKQASSEKSTTSVDIQGEDVDTTRSPATTGGDDDDGVDNIPIGTATIGGTQHSTTVVSRALATDPQTAEVLAQYFSGNNLLRGADPAAHCYCGHQFGSFAGQLGDGAAMYLGEVVLPPTDGDISAAIEHQDQARVQEWEQLLREKEKKNKKLVALGSTGGGGSRSGSPQQKQQLLLSDVPMRPLVVKERRSELQLKGSGPTPYSRSADGRKVLRSSLREFIASEAIHSLGIPTTRAATLVTSDSTVERDPMYTGKVIQESVTVISRVAPSFLRFGSFQICNPRDPRTGASGPSSDFTAPLVLGGAGGGSDGDMVSAGAAGIGTAHRHQILHQLWEFTMEHYFPEVVRDALNAYAESIAAAANDDDDVAVAQLRRRLADLPLAGFVNPPRTGDATDEAAASKNQQQHTRSHTGGAKRTEEREREARDRAIAAAALEGGLTPFQLYLATNLHLKAEITIAVFSEIVKRTAELVAQWQCIGFCHGVLNTDNMSILGLTIDYGPYGFMTHYDEDYVCNASDDSGRYSYKNQPEMCQWNCAQLANSLSLLFSACDVNESFYNQNNRSEGGLHPNISNGGGGVAAAAGGGDGVGATTMDVLTLVKGNVMAKFNTVVSEKFDVWYQQKRTELLRRKLGLVKGIHLDVEKKEGDGGGEEEEGKGASCWTDKEVDRMINDLFTVMQESGADFTETFLALKTVKLYEARELNAKSQQEVEEAHRKMMSSVIDRIVDSCSSVNGVKKTLERRIRGLRSGMSPEQVIALLHLAETDPGTLDQMFHAPREAVIEGLQEEHKKILNRQTLMEKYQALREMESAPETEGGGLENLTEQLTKSNTTLWTAFVQHYYDMLLFRQHPDDDDGHQERRRHVAMQNSNPRFILRPWILQEVIVAAEGGAGVGTECSPPERAAPVDHGLDSTGGSRKIELGTKKKKGPDFALVQQLLDRVQTPFEEDSRDGVLWQGGSAPPEDGLDICVSCSS